MTWLVLALASIVAGESQGCPAEAQRAVVHVARNRLAMPWVQEVTDGWYGLAEPTAADVARVVEALGEPDPTGGALFMFGSGDVERLRARNGGALPPWLAGYQPGQRWTCDDGRTVETWRPSFRVGNDTTRKDGGGRDDKARFWRFWRFWE